jgi:hypothetical protein
MGMLMDPHRAQSATIRRRAPNAVANAKRPSDQDSVDSMIVYLLWRTYADEPVLQGVYETLKMAEAAAPAESIWLPCRRAGLSQETIAHAFDVRDGYRDVWYVEQHKVHS